MVVAILGKNQGENAVLSVEMRVQDRSNWESISPTTKSNAQVGFTSSQGKYVTLADSFKGVIYSLDITSSGRGLSLQRTEINGSPN